MTACSKWRWLLALLTAGRWSVDMFAMFHLGRPDVLPVGDLGVRKGMQTLYGLKVSFCEAFQSQSKTMLRWQQGRLCVACEGT